MAVTINPGDTIQAAITANANGTELVFAAGTHRPISFITPKPGNIFTGLSGSVISGAVVLSSWTVSGGTWYASGQTQAGVVYGECDAASPRCSYPEDLFIDSQPMHHVATLGEVTTGTWFFDYAADRIYIGDNPAGHLVETSVEGYSFTSYPTVPANVTFQGVTIEKYANLAQYGVIHADGTTGWIVQDSTVRLCHGLGIRLGDSMQVLRNWVVRNGQEGIAGVGADVLVSGNEIAYNNYAGYSSGWEAGATKFVQTTGLIVRRNWVHHNNGHGLWADIDNQGVLFEDNVVEDNVGIGIIHEISYGGIIRRNTCRHNGTWTGNWYTAGGAMLISASPDVEVYENALTDNGFAILAMQQARGTGAYGDYLVQNLNVHDNTITQSATGAAVCGLIQDVSSALPFTSRNNHWTNNRYALGAGTPAFAWADNAAVTFQAWKAYGHDMGAVNHPWQPVHGGRMWGGTC